MVRVVACHARDRGSNPVGPKSFSLWNYFTGGSGNSATPEGAGFGQERAPSEGTVDARLQKNKGGKGEVIRTCLTASLLG